MTVNTTVAIVGLSHPHSEVYLETLEVLEEVVGVVLVEPDETVLRSAANQTSKVRGRYAALEPALEHAELTHVLVALPNDRTPAALVRAIEAGKAVFTEKPGARSAAEFEPVLSALDQRPVPFVIAYLNRWSPPVQQVRDLYRARAIGRLTSVELRMVTTQVGMRTPGSWLFRREAAGGGVMAWLGCHWLDALRFVTGEEIVRVQTELATLSGEGIDVEDTAAVSFRTTGAAVGSMHAGYLLAVGNPGYRAAGHDIAMILRGTLGAIYYAGGRQEAPLLLESVTPGWRGAPRRTYQFAPVSSPGYGGLSGLDFFRAFPLGQAGRSRARGRGRRAAAARGARRNLRGGRQRARGRRQTPPVANPPRWGTETAPHHTEETKANRMVATQREDTAYRAQDRVETSVDLTNGLLGVKWTARDVTGISHLGAGKGREVLGRVVRT
jgi:predicted dehydrogenase